MRLVAHDYGGSVGQELIDRALTDRLIASRVSANRFRSAMDAVRGSKLTEAEFDNLWHGVALHDGQKLAHLHIRYNAERAAHHRRWEKALADWEGPLQLVWGPEDPAITRNSRRHRPSRPRCGVRRTFQPVRTW